MNNLSVTALQLDLFWHEPNKNKTQIEKLLEQEKRVGDIIVLPEMFTTGFSMEADTQAEEMNGASIAWMVGIAKKYESCVMGSLIIQENGTYYNRFIATTSEGIIATYDKRHPFSLAKEHLTYKPGENVVIFTYKGWKICPQICYDLRFPVWARNRKQPNNTLAYDLLIYVANWPEARVYHWETLLQARAIENQSFVIGVNRVGNDQKNLNYSGSSMIVHPSAQKLAFNSGEECLLQAELKSEELQAYRKKFPFWQDADDFEVTGLEFMKVTSG